MAENNFNDWEWQNQHVERRMKNGEYVSAESIMIAAGPPRFSQVGFGDAGGGEIQINDAGLGASSSGTNASKGPVYPIGIIENFGLQQQKQLQRMFEIGSKRSYFVPGRTIGAVNMGRVMFWGPSLMRVLYAYYPESLITTANGAKMDLDSDGISLEGSDKLKATGLPEIKMAPGTVVGKDQQSKATNFMNLASDLFNQPLGILVYMKDSRDKVYSAFYLEDVYIQSHQMNINASSVLVAEGISMQYDRLVPVDVAV